MKGAVVLIVLLGLTWSFGLLYVNEGTIIFAYLFTVLNSLQGLFIFLFNIVGNDKVRNTFLSSNHYYWRKMTESLLLRSRKNTSNCYAEMIGCRISCEVILPQLITAISREITRDYQKVAVVKPLAYHLKILQ